MSKVKQEYPPMYLVLKLLGGVTLLLAFLLLLAPWYSLPLFLISFFMFYVAYEVFPPLHRKRLLDGKEVVARDD